MQASQRTRSHRTLHKLSLFYNPNYNQPSSSHEELRKKRNAFKTLKPISDPATKYLAYTSTFKKQPEFTESQQQFQISSKEIDKLYGLLEEDIKSQRNYEAIDEILCRCHISFFENIRNFLPNEDYHELIDNCQLMSYADNSVICRKGSQDQHMFILLDGTVSFNEEKVTKNILLGLEQIERSSIYSAQKGSLLNSETLNAPKHNIYTVISHSPTTVIVFNATETYFKLLKMYFVKQLDEKSHALSNTSLFQGISSQNIKRLLPYFFTKNFYKFNEFIYRQDDKAQFVYWILEGEVQLIKEKIPDGNVSNITYAKHVHKVVKLSKYEVFGIDEYVFKPNCKYLFTARVCSQNLKTICIPYKSLAYIQDQYPCLNENIDFYLKRAAVMHSKIVQKNHKLMEVKENIRIMPKKKKNKRNKKKKRNPQTLQWWGLAQNTVGHKKYKLQMPKFITLQQNQPLATKTQPMFESSNYQSSKIQGFKRKLFQQDINELIKKEQIKKSTDENDNSPYKTDYAPKLNKLRIKMLDMKPKAIDETEKVKKKLLSYAKNFGSFCDKLNLD